MFSGIKATRSYPLSTPSSYGLSPAVTGQAKPSFQSYDHFHRSSALGEDIRIRDTVSQISHAIRVRPTKHELTSLQQQVQQGTYQPDTREIATRMLLTYPQEEKI